MVSHFPFQGGSELVKPTRFKVLGGAGIRCIHNRCVVELFPNVEGRHGRVMHLLDSCCGNFVLEAHSVRNYQQDGRQRRELVLTWRQQISVIWGVQSGMGFKV